MWTASLTMEVIQTDPCIRSVHRVSQGSKVWTASLTMEVIQTDPCIRSVHRGEAWGPKCGLPASLWRLFRLTPASGQYTGLGQGSKVWTASLTMEVIQTDPCIRSVHRVSQGSKVWTASLTMEVIQTDPCIRSVHRVRPGVQGVDCQPHHGGYSD